MKRIWCFSLITCLLASLFFYEWQNHFAELGGNVSLVKALWLGLTIFFWLLWPPMVWTDRRSNSHLKQVYILFWIVMLLRTGIELCLLSINAWHYRYGIAHDIFSLILLLTGWLYTLKHKALPAQRTLAVMALMFTAESGFAYYIAEFNTNANHADLWFITWQAPHLTNQIITLMLVLGLSAWLYYIYHYWVKTFTDIK